VGLFCVEELLLLLLFLFTGILRSGGDMAEMLNSEIESIRSSSFDADAFVLRLLLLLLLW
jgi:hypothetical protein